MFFLFLFFRHRFDMPPTSVFETLFDVRINVLFTIPQNTASISHSDYRNTRSPNASRLYLKPLRYLLGCQQLYHQDVPSLSGQTPPSRAFFIFISADVEPLP
jgi:hypothetical protein